MFASPYKNGNRRQSGGDYSNYNVFYHTKYFMVLQLILEITQLIFHTVVSSNPHLSLYISS